MTIKDRAYLISHLHAIKYHNFDCIGLLIGNKDKNTITITNSIPLSHQRVQTGLLEVAFDMVESVYLDEEGENQQILGIYEAALPGSLVGGRE